MKKAVFILFALMWWTCSVSPVHALVVFEEDFEDGWGSWSADNGVWEVGEPTTGPGAAYSPSNCAATILDGNYPGGTDSRLISPQIQLPGVGVDEEVFLRVWQWFSYSLEYYNSDRGDVQIRVYEDGSWSDWSTLGSIYEYSAVWDPRKFDLTAYAGKLIRIGFFHIDNLDSFGDHRSAGWYLDDIEVVAQPIPYFETVEDFEAGWGEWSADNGVWQVGVPTSGPGAAYSPVNCAATVLDGNYPGGTDSRLISPQVILPDAGPDEEVLLRFRQWFSYAGEYYNDDRGLVQISVWESGVWSSWETLQTKLSYIPNWHHEHIDLTPYAGERVRLAFQHVDYYDSFGNHRSTGWYVDDVAIVKHRIPYFGGVEDFESGWGSWYSSNDIWEIGTPASGPGACFSGANCAATILDGNYPAGPDSCLIAPPARLPVVVPPEEVLLTFWHWFSYAGEYYNDDRAEVRIRTYTDGIWSDWETLDSFYQYSSVWTPAQVDLAAYSDQTVQVGFCHLDYSDSFGHHESAGWYIDNVQITGIPCTDSDGDGYGDPANPNCTYPLWDCNDSNPDVNPAVTEGPVNDPTCSDMLDNNCDGHADLEDTACTACQDNDGDGYGNPASLNCPYPGLDCNDNDSDVNPGMQEIPENGLDDDCDPGTPSWGTPASTLGATHGRASDLTNYLAMFLVPLGAVLVLKGLKRRR